MCTLVILNRPGHPWPLLVAGNRDEMADRPWSPPARHWPDRPEVVAGLDHGGGGSWFGINDHGLVAAVTNRSGTLGPHETKRSRGELVLEALDHAEAAAAAEALAELDPRAYRGFNLFVGDPRDAYWLCHREQPGGAIERHLLAPGLHMLSAGDLDDAAAPRVAAWRPRFADAPIPDPAAGDWRGWSELLGSRIEPGADEDPRTAPNFQLDSGFGTICSHMVAIPRYPGHDAAPLFWFAAGAPHRAPFEPVSL